LVMERIELMYETNQMDQETYNGVPEVLRRIESFLQVQLTEENAGACVSHLIKAIQRVKNNEAIEECSVELMAEMMKTKHLYDFSLEILKPYNIHNMNLEAEAAFIASYFAMMTEEENE
jgi:transcriptional regulatory protein LevR